MPIKLPKLLPAREILEKENIFIMDDERASQQDIRPLNIVILNLMPEKENRNASSAITGKYLVTSEYCFFKNSHLSF